jgi:hypothetical protein
MNDPAEPGEPDGGDHNGGGPQGERLEGSLTDGGSVAGEGEDARRFGAGRSRRAGKAPEQQPDPAS